MTTKLNYSTKGSGQNIILLHGWGTHSGIWQNLVNKLSPSCCVTVVDLPGYGNNLEFLADHTLLAISAKISALITQPAIILGWSMGGLVAMALAIYYPHLVTKLIITNSSPCFIANNNWPGITISTINAFKKNLTKNLARTLLRFLLLQINLDSSQKPRKQYQRLKKITNIPTKYSPHILHQGLLLLLNADLREQLTTIQVPILWLLGEHDRLVPATISHSLKIYLPAATIKILPDAAHVPFLFSPDYFLQIILKFMYAESL